MGRAKDLNELEEQLQTVPPESLTYHAQSNHFSHWLMARTEFALAAKLRPRKVSDFASPEHLRRNLIESINDYRREQSELLIGDFNAETFKPSETSFLRIGAGSLGGKARGLAFVRHLLRKNRITRRFPGIRIAVPPALVLATDAFDQFMAENNLLDFALQCEDDAEILQMFLAAPLSAELQENLKVFLAEITYPLAVRSSSLLEDSQYQPFTGVYETFMLGNQQADPAARLAELIDAIKRVYASTFSRHAKAYVRATPYRLEEEKMAVIVQQLVGTVHGQRFYPDFSGVVRSHNFYPVPPMTFADGIAAVALGLGRAVVDGGKCLSFCPRYPQSLLQFSSVEDILANSQTEFWALALNGVPQGRPGHLHEMRFGLDAAEADGTLPAVGSTYSVDNQAVYDGVSRPGVRIISFAPMLKHGLFPLATILETLVKAGEDALGIPVEIEFAVRLPRRAWRGRGVWLPANPSADPFARSPGFIARQSGAAAGAVPKQQGSGQRAHRESVRRGGRRFAALRAQPQPGSRQGGGSFQWLARRGEPAVSADWSGALGIERSMARHSRGVGRNLRRARHC